MAQLTLDNGSSFGVQRQKINDNFAELYTAVNASINTNTEQTLGNKTLTNTGAITFDTTPADTTLVAGKTVWNDTDGTVDLGLKGATVALQLGQTQVLRVTNKAGSTLAIGEVVYIKGSVGSRLTVDRADADTEALSSNTIGIVAESILNNSDGFIITSGILKGLNTSSFTEGAAIYLSSTTGAFTTTKPVAPAHAVFLGFVVRSHVTLGSIYINVINGNELDELHNVLITNVQDKQVLAYDSNSSVWKNVSNLTLSDLVVNHPTATPSGTNFIGLTYNGSIIGSISQSNTNAVLFNTTSDYRLKHVIGSITDSGNFIDSLKPKVWLWKSNGQLDSGFIAHEAQEVAKNSVTGTKDAVDSNGNPIYQTMQASSPEIIANIVAELQSLRLRVKELETK